jgi:hypothetical protein
MAASPQFKVYTGEQEYVAAFRYLEDAALFVAVRGTGATVRRGHALKDVLWREGAEAFPASESYDRAAGIMQQRLAEPPCQNRRHTP